MSYQDEWVAGSVKRRGYRECERRYQLVKNICLALRRHDFTVCDIGANLCYFGLRLAADFPGVQVTAFESHRTAYKRASLLLSVNGSTRIDLHNKRLRLPDIDAMARTRGFDVVLALSVLHHTAGDSSAWLSALRRLGSIVIVEAAGQDSHRSSARAFRVPSDAILLGKGESHLDVALPRSIFMLNGGIS
jgi:2-polyprenyl-3-methyl-5-hydroxy-6-metoxy-1,4-benzoquinol methylase